MILRDQHIAEIEERKAARQEALKVRSDYKSLSPGEKMDRSYRVHRSDSHTVKIYRYRDRLLRAISQNSRVDPNLFHLLDRRSEERMGTVKENTEIAMYSDFCTYAEFCNEHGLLPLPVIESSFDLFLSYRMAGYVSPIRTKRTGEPIRVDPAKKTTLDRYVASLVRWHKWLELDDPRKSYTIGVRLDEIKLKADKRDGQKKGLRAEHLKNAVDTHDHTIPRDVADLTLLFVAFETMCRRSELVAMEWTDISFDDDESGLIHIASSKTDKDEDGAFQYISPATVQLLMYWKKVSGQNKGAIFRGIYSDGKLADKLSDKGVARSFKRIARKIGISAEDISGHSTRVGSAQEMAENNIDSTLIMLSGRWKDVKMIERYTKKIKAKRSGMAKLTKKIGFTPGNLLPPE